MLTVGFAAWFLHAATRGFSWRSLGLVVLVEIALGVWAGRALAVVALAAVTAASYWALRKPVREAELGAAGWLIWLLLLAGMLWLAPNASFLMTWSLLPPLTLALAWPRSSDHVWLPLLASLPAVALWAPLIYTVYLGIGIGAPQVPMAALALLAVLLATALLRAADWARGSLGLLGTVGGMAVIAGAWSNEGFDARHPRPGELFYAYDADNGQSYWASSDLTPDAWTLNALGDDRRAIAFDSLLPGAEGELLTGHAPAAALTPAEIHIVHQERSTDARSLRLRLISWERAEYINLWLPAGGRIRSAAVDGREMAIPEAPAGPLWRWRLYGLPPAGAEIALTVTGTEPLPVRITEVAYRWPPGLSPPPRPAGSMRTPYSWSDATVIHASYSL